MAQYQFYQDEKVTMWTRQHFTIEAENEEQAKESAMHFVKQSVTTGAPEAVIYDQNEDLIETQESMSVQKNDGYPTLELYDWNGDELGNNAE